jgi:uncharacterized protein YtpQ (UPF0354 family)
VSWDYNPFGEREPPPMSEELFVTVVTARLRPHADIQVESQRGLELNLRVRGEPRTTQLERYYRRYREDPAALTPLIQEFIDSVLNARLSPVVVEENLFARIAPQLLPQLITAAEWHYKRESGVRLIVRPLVQDLGITLVLDEADAMTFVELDAMARWDVDSTTAYETAMANLEQRAQTVAISQIGDGVETLLIDRAADGYAATRAILSSRLQDWANRVPDELVLGLPQRDFLIGFSSAHPNFAALRAQVEQDAQPNQPHTLLSNLLVYRGGTLEVFK